MQAPYPPLLRWSQSTCSKSPAYPYASSMRRCDTRLIAPAKVIRDNRRQPAPATVTALAVRSTAVSKLIRQDSGCLTISTHNPTRAVIVIAWAGACFLTNMKHTLSDKNACRLGFAADSTTVLVQCSGASCPFAGPSSVPQKPKHRHRTMHASHDHYRMGAAVGTALEIVSRNLMTILILQLLKLECRTFGANHLKR
jgi:hypothetical protein